MKMQNVGYTKKGQLKIQQMAFMLIAVTIFFVLVLLFFLVIKVNDLNKSAEDVKRERAVLLVSKLASTPEFYFRGVENGVDLDKLMVLKDSGEYRDYWGVESIIVKRIYPPQNNVECDVGNYPDCDTIKIFTSRDNAPIATYVALCRKVEVNGRSEDKCGIGLLMLEEKKNE